MNGLWISVLALVAMGMFAGKVKVAAKREVLLARRKEAHTAASYSLTKSLAAENEPDRILDVITRHIVETFGRPIIIFLPASDGLAVTFRSTGINFDEDAWKVAAWVFENADEAGYGTERFPDSKMRYRPLKTGHGTVGVLGIQANTAQGPLSEEQQELLGVCMNQAALAITRADLARKAQRAEVLQQTDKLQKALLNSVSHDLRTPLVSVIGGLNTVLNDAPLLDASTQRALLENARGEAVRLNRVIQNLLDMTRLEGGAVLAKIEPCDVYDVIGAALEQMGEAALQHPISVSIEPNLPLTPMDHPLIVQVLVNLLDNALKYSPRNLPIEIKAGREGDRLQMRISNGGEGIPASELDRVFDKFFRGTSAAKSRGVGLGLSICKGFVEAHNGRIWAQRPPQGGTEIAFQLPLESRR